MGNEINNMSSLDLALYTVSVETRIRELYDKLEEQGVSSTVEAFEHTKPPELKNLEKTRDEALIEIQKRKITREEENVIISELQKRKIALEEINRLKDLFRS